MKLLFDANLSPALVARLTSEYPDSAHVRDVGLVTGSDTQIWEYAKANSFAIVSKDTDFRERSFVHGFPPKVVWLDVGNAGTSQIDADRGPSSEGAVTSGALRHCDGHVSLDSVGRSQSGPTSACRRRRLARS